MEKRDPKSKDLGILRKLERTREQIFPWNLQKEHSHADPD